MKKIITILLCFILVLSLVACGNKGVTQPKVNDTPSKADIKEGAFTAIDEGVVEEKEDEVTPYLLDNEDLSDLTQVLSVRHANFYVDKVQSENSVDMMELLGEIFAMSMSQAFSDESEESESTEEYNEEELVEKLNGIIRVSDSGSYLLMNMTTGAQAIVQNNNVEGAENPFKDINVLEEDEANLQAYLQENLNIAETAESSDSEEENIESEIEEDSEYTVGKVYKFEDKVIFELDAILKLSDNTEIVSAEEATDEIRVVNVYGYGVVVFDDEDSFTGIFLTESEDRGNTLLSARSLKIDKTVEGVNDDELYSGLLGGDWDANSEYDLDEDYDWDFEDEDWDSEDEEDIEDIEDIEGVVLPGRSDFGEEDDIGGVVLPGSSDFD